MGANSNVHVLVRTFEDVLTKPMTTLPVDVPTHVMTWSEFIAIVVLKKIEPLHDYLASGIRDL